MTAADAPPPFRQLAGDVVCIDAAYIAPGLACFYLLGDGDEYALVDTGTACSLDNLLATLDALGIAPEQLRYVVPTHVHLDHAGAAGLYLQSFPAAELLVHPRGARHLVDPGKLIASAIAVYGEATFHELYGELVPAPPERVRSLADGEAFYVGSRRLEAVHLRGHAEHHFCLWDERSEGWFTGDNFGISYDFLRLPTGAFLLPATTPTQFDPAAYRATVRTLAARGPRWLYLTHYGALAFEAQQVDLLCAQLHRYEALEGTPGEALPAALSACTEEALGAFAGPSLAAELAARLAMDLTLNAQGIAVRSQRAATP